MHQLKYNKKSLLLSAVVLGLLTSNVQANVTHVSANSNGGQVVNNGISKEPGKTYHIVQSGNTVYNIANKYGISQEALRLWNTIPESNVISVNQIVSADGMNVYNQIVKEKNTFQTTTEFINKVAPIAVATAKKYQVYPSVMIAQSVLETGSGKSELATMANNYFGIKGTYNGNSIYKMSPEEINGTTINQSSRFRVYPTLRESFEDNGKRLRLGPTIDSNSNPWSPDHYSGTWVENTKSYYDATLALVKAGYATDSSYNKKLENIIKEYNLIKYDKQIYDFIDESITGPMTSEKPVEPVKPVEPSTSPNSVADVVILSQDAYLFIADSMIMPTVSEINAMNATNLGNLQSELKSLRSLYNGLSSAEKLDQEVSQWANQLTTKESAVQTRLEALSQDKKEEPVKEKPVKQDNGDAFIAAALKLPSVSQINNMNAKDLANAAKEITSVRSLYNNLTSTAKSNGEVARWIGYVTAKENAVNALLDYGRTFIEAAIKLPNLSEIERMSETNLKALQTDMANAKALYNNLSKSTQSESDVARWLGYVNAKSTAAQERLNQLTNPDLKAADAFISTVNQLPMVSEINRMTTTQLTALEAQIKMARNSYNGLSASVKKDADVVKWIGYLDGKEKARSAIFTTADAFIVQAIPLPSVSQIQAMNNTQRTNAQNAVNRVRRAYNALTPAAKGFPDVARWEGYLTAKENALTTFAGVTVKSDIIYVIQSGDTLNSIAEDFQVNLNALIARNPNLVPTNLRTGQTVRVPNPVARPMNHSQATDGKHVIYLDAGHGGSDGGASYSGTREKDLNLTLSRKLTSKLQSMGYTVLTSRSSDTTLTLTERSRRANASNADIFVSLHHNAMGRANSSVSGIETFYYKYNPEYTPTMNLENHNDGARIASSAYLAHLIQDNLIGSTGAADRGVKTSAFTVISETALPSALIEFGFMDNSAELAKLKTDSYQNTMVNAVAKSIDTYFKNIYK